MSLLADLPVGAAIGIDTAPFVYFLEAHPTLEPVIKPLFTERSGPFRAWLVERGAPSRRSL